MFVGPEVLAEARKIAQKSDFYSVPLHRIGTTLLYIASNPTYKYSGYDLKGTLTLEYGDGIVVHPILFVPQTC